MSVCALIRNTLRGQNEYSSFITSQYEQMIASVQNTTQVLINDPQISSALTSYAQQPTSIESSRIEEKLQYYLSAFPKIMYCTIEMEDGTYFETFSNTNTDARKLYSSVKDVMENKTNCTYYSNIMPAGLFPNTACTHSLFTSRKLSVSGHSYIYTVFYNADDYISNIETIMADTFTGYMVLDRNSNKIYQSSEDAVPLTEYAQADNTTQNEPCFTTRGVFCNKNVISVGWKIITYTSWSVFFRDILLIGGIVLLFYILPPVFFYFIIVPTNQKYLHPLSVLTEQISGYSAGQQLVLEIHTGDEIEQLSHSVNKMIDKINHQIDDIRIKERENCLTQYSLLATQIDPHFIYNTLNIINIMARQSGQDNIIEVNTALSKILRERFSTKTSIFETIETGLDTIQQYHTIMKCRYHNLVKIDINAETSILNEKIPKNLLIPIIENAYYHGLSDDEGHICGEIEIYIYSIAEEIIIEISDNGSGMPPEQICYLKEHHFQTSKQDRTHIGLSNVYERLNYIYKEAFSIDINSTLGHGTTFSISIPYYHTSLEL